MQRKSWTALCAFGAASMIAHAGTPISWDSPISGDWNLSTNWNPATVPGITDTAILGHASAYTVTYNTSSSINGLDITNPDVLFNIPHGRTLTMLGNLNNEGTMVLNSTTVGATTSMNFATTTLGGNGTLMMTSTGSLSRVRTTTGSVFTQGPNHTIEGRGQIEADLINNGLISANIAATDLRMIINDKTNNGTIRAVNGAIMDISSITLTQGASGELIADGAGSEMEITNSSIIGGNLNGLNDGAVEFNGTSTVDAVVLTGLSNIPHGAELNILNSIENNGTLALNSTMIGATTTIDFTDSGAFNGTGTLLMTSNGSLSRLRTDAGQTMTNSSTHTIEGRGQIEADLINNGLISSNIAASDFRMIVNDKTNNATMRATNGAIMDISSITVTQGVNGDIIASGAGSQVELSNSTVIGGDLMSTGGADIEINGTSTVDGVVLTGLLNIRHGTELNILNSIENNGTLALNSTMLGATTTIDFSDSGAFNGTGALLMTSNGSLSRLRTDAGQTLTNSSTHTIEGRGQIEADLINEGLIDANIAASDLRMIVNDKTNNATMRATNGAIMDISSITVTQGASGQIVADGVDSEVELTNSTIDGGDLTAINDGFFEIIGTSHVKNVDFLGTMNIPHFNELGVGFGTLNNGLIVVNSTGAGATTSLVFDEEIIIGGAGTIRLTRTNTLSRLIAGVDVTTGGLGTEQRLEGVGRIEIDLINHGTIAPGLSVGTMNAIQPIFNSSASVFEAEINDAGADLLDSTNTIELNGHLDVQFIDGFDPDAYWVRTIMEGSDITGKFETYTAPAPPEGLVFRFHNTGTEFLIGATCPGDTDLNNIVDIFDVFGFLELYNAQSLLADYEPDGVIDIFDVFAFLAAFNANGCTGK